MSIQHMICNHVSALKSYVSTIQHKLVRRSVGCVIFAWFSHALVSCCGQSIAAGACIKSHFTKTYVVAACMGCWAARERQALTGHL